MNPLQASLDTAEAAVAELKKQGAQDALVRYRSARGVQCQVRDGRVEKLQESVTAELTVHVYTDGRYAAHTTNDLRKAELASFLSDAVKLTKMLDPDPARSLPPKELALHKPAELGLFDSAYAKIDTDARKRLAQTAEAAGRSDKRVVSATADFSDEHGTTALVGSNGTHGAQRDTWYSLSAEVTVAEGDKRPEDWWVSTSRTVKGLGDAETVGKQAMQRAIDRVGAAKLKSAETTLVIENRSAGRLLSYWLQALFGANLQQKRSFLDGMVGKQVAAARLFQLDDNPALPGGLGSRSFDREGMVAKPMPIVDAGGVLRNYYIDWYNAQRLKVQPTTGSWSNLVLNPGADPLDKLLAGVDTGILVTSFIGGNSNSLTGDFSLGIQGRVIDKGKLGAPVGEMNLSGNHKTFWNKLAAVGNDPYLYSSLRVPSLRFDGTAVSGA